MDKIRLGNDIEMRWSIFTRDGDNKVPYNLEGRALTLSVVNRTGESEIEFFAEGNIVTGVFRGRDQKILGKHGVILRENNGKDGMRTIDACDAFELVACSCEEAIGSSGTIQLFHLTFDSTIGAITGTIDPILNYEAEQAEAERKANEIIRKANEEQRIDNEKQRNVNEILRNIAEEERKNAEQERIVNEDLRKADETERKTNEESRLQNESERVSSEEERLYAESIRVANENARIASEAKRAEAETARIEAEDKRIVSEKNRLSAESSRIANEDSRRANEDSRLSAEAKRVSNEKERQIAEEERQTKFASMVVQSTGDATDKVMSQKAVTEALKGKQNKLTAGIGISIDGDVISATLDMDIIRVVDALPSVGEANIIYLVPAEQPSESDLFEEWVWTDRWERIGSAKIDLSDYATKGYVDTKISSTEENLVHKDGFERITGRKQFQNGINVGLFNSLVANEDSVQSGAWLDQNDVPAPFVVADPTADDHAATKYYVDEGLATKQNTLTDTDGSYGQRVAELEKQGIASQAKLSELENELYEEKTIDYQDGVYELLAGYENNTPLKAMISAGTVIKEVKKAGGGIANVFYFRKENGALVNPVVQPTQLPYTLAENAYFLTSNQAMNITLVYEKIVKEAKLDSIAKEIANTNKNIGNLENLNTQTKDSIVNAINEVKASIPEIVEATTDTVIDTESGKTQKDINRELGNAIEGIVPTKTVIITDEQDGQLSDMSIRINGLVVSSNFWYLRYKTFQEDTNVHCKAIGINVWYAVSDTLPNIGDYLVSFKFFQTDGEEADVLVPKGKYFLYSYFNKGTIRLEISTSTKAEVATKDEIPSLVGYAKLTDIEKKVTIADKKVLVMGDSISTKVYGRYNKWVEPLIAEGFFPNIAPEGGDYQWLYSECYNSIHATGFVTDGAYAGATRTGDDFLTRLKAISNPSTFDYVIVFGGVNDYIQGVSFNEPKGNYKSFKSALQEFFEYLCTNFINASIMVITPLYVWNHDTVKGEGNEDVYIEAIRNEAKKYHLPVLDSANDACFYPDVPIFKTTWTHEGDGVHPNEEWCRKHLSQYIKSFICRHL